MADSEPVIVGIDASAAARIAGVAVGTLNVWIGRGLIPGISVGTQGRARLFDLDTVIHLSIMVALVRLQYPAPLSSAAAFQARDWCQKPGAKLIIGPPRNLPGGRLGGTPTLTPAEAASQDALDGVLDSFADGHPEGYTIVELDRLVRRVGRAFENPDATETLVRRFGHIDDS